LGEPTHSMAGLGGACVVAGVVGVINFGADGVTTGAGAGVKVGVGAGVGTGAGVGVDTEVAVGAGAGVAVGAVVVGDVPAIGGITNTMPTQIRLGFSILLAR